MAQFTKKQKKLRKLPGAKKLLKKTGIKTHNDLLKEAFEASNPPKKKPKK